MRRTFTLLQANLLLPRLTAILKRTSQLAMHLATLTRKSDPEAEIQLHLVQELLEEESQRIEKLGVIARDLTTGAIDFPSVLDGEREVVLCWRAGEREVAFFHDAGTDCQSRRSVVGHHFFDRRQLGPPRD